MIIIIMIIMIITIVIQAHTKRGLHCIQGQVTLTDVSEARFTCTLCLPMLT